MVSTPCSLERSSFIHTVPLATILLVAAWLRWRAGTVDGLWLDEVFGASYTNLSLIETVVAVLRFDIHPPLYYLQLNLWAMVSKSDGGLLLNSVFWSLASLLIAYAGVARVYGRVFGLITAVLVGTAGSEIFYASELRMYSMISFNVLALWIVGERWIEKPAKATFYWLIALLFALSMLHSAAFLAVGCVLSFLLIRLWQTANLTRWKSWLAISFIAVVVLSPWLINASFRSVSHALTPDFDIASATIGGWLVGYFPGLPLHVDLMATAFVLLSIGLVVWKGNSRARATMLAFVVLPLFVTSTISLLLRPIWLDRTLAFAAPFFAIAIVQALATSIRKPRKMQFAIFSLLVVWCFFILVAAQLVERSVVNRKMEFREAAFFIAANNSESLPVYVPSNFRFWGMARYLVGPSWGSLLKIQDVERVDSSETWARIYKRVGTERLAWVGLRPISRKVSAGMFEVWIGLSPLPSTAIRAGYFFVGDMNDAKLPSACPQGNEVWRQVFRGVLVAKCKVP